MKHIEWYSGKRVLVTGGAGFIGSHLVEALLNAQAKVTILDDFSTGSLENIDPIKNKITIIAGSVDDQETCLKACKGIDIVFHLAAISSVVQAEECPDDCYSVNIQGTYNMLNAARLNKVSRFIFASSAAVYGSQQGLLSESLPCKPISVYGHSKYMAEEWCKWFATHHQLNITCLRYFNVFGERQRGDLPHSAIVAKLNHHMRNNLPITIFGDGTQTRDFVPVERINEANMKIGANNNCVGNYINIATGKPQSINEIMTQIKNRYANFSALITYNPARENDIQHSVGDITLLDNVL
jgi:nucleoside-diphosphate-sugar epimerase